MGGIIKIEGCVVESNSNREFVIEGDEIIIENCLLGKSEGI